MKAKAKLQTSYLNNAFLKILIFPKGPNPYQELLYTKLREQHPDSEFSYLKTNRIKFLFYPIIFTVKRLQGYKIFHIHWLSFSISLPLPYSEYISYYYSIFCLMTLKLLGFKIVWTVHDVIPHEKETINDTNVSKLLSKIAKIKIIHSSLTISQMKDMDLNINNTVIIPHGNYNNAYKDIISLSEARKRLNIRPNEFVILFFGLIRPYKGIDDLLVAFEKIKDQNVRLVIAGKCTDPVLYRKILDAKKHNNIDFYEGHVDDNKVSIYFKASDIVCLPFKEITTSGSVLLALSFGKPIIAPRIGALVDLPTNVGFLYDPTKTDALLHSLTGAVSSKHLDTISTSASKYANSLSWDKIAEKTYEVYEDVLSL